MNRLFFILMFLFSPILAVGDASWTVVNKQITFVNHVITLAEEISFPKTEDAVDLLTEIRTAGGRLLGKKTIWIMRNDELNLVKTVLDANNLVYSVEEQEVSAEQLAHKQALDGQFSSKQEYIDAGMPHP